MRAVLADPRVVAATWPALRLRAITQLAVTVTEAPWSLSAAALAPAHAAGLTADDVLQVVALAAYAGYLNRIAEAVQLPLDCEVQYLPAPVERDIAPWPIAPDRIARRHAIPLARRPASAAALTAWRGCAFFRDAPLSRRQRTLIARWVAIWLGDGTISSPEDLTLNPLDDALRVLAEIVTRAPWQLSDLGFAPLRSAGFDDAALFDVCATASSADVISRIEVALAALAA